MNAHVTALMAANHGLIRRDQAIEAGMAPEQVDRMVRTQQWVVVRRGVYAEASYVATLTTVREQRLLMDLAASMRVSRPHVLSHDSAAYALGLPILHARPPVTHLTRRGVVGSHIRHGVKHHPAPYPDGQVIEVRGIACLDAARTAIDIAREHGYLPGLVAIDSALRLGHTFTDLRRVVEQMRNWPYVTIPKDAIASASPDTDSIIETLGRDLVTELGFGVPDTQFGLTADGRTAWCDLILGRHVIECDGRVKYRRVEDDGYADDPDEALWNEKVRQDWVCGFKLGMSRLTWDDCFGAARERAKERIRREYLDTCRRFGTDVSDLAPFRPSRPRPRPGSRTPRRAA